MKIMLALLLLCGSLFAGLFESPVNEKSSGQIKEMMAAIAKRSVVQVSFVQTKEMAALKKPLVAEGTLLFVKDRGIIWSQKTPYVEQIILKPNGTVKFLDQSGKETVQPSKSGDRINAMMNTLFSGDLNQVMALFDLYFENGTEWRLGMIPKKASMKKGVESMTMVCRKSGIVKALTMVGSGGTVTMTFEPLANQTVSAEMGAILARP